MLSKINLIQGIIESNFRRLSSPYKATFAVTYRCNLKCKICKVWDNSPPAEFTLGEIGKIFKNFKRLGWIDLTGGEVTLRGDIIDVINVISRNARNLCVFHISTNGRRPEIAVLMAKEVLKAGLLPVINVSVDGPRELNDRLRGVEGAFHSSLETFKKLRSSAPQGHYYLSCTLSRSNIQYVDEMIVELKRELPGFSFSDLHFNLFHASSHYYKNHEIEGEDKIDPVAVMKYLSLSKKGSRVKIFLENQYLKGMSKFLSEDKFPVPCQALNATCFIAPSGRVYACGIFDEPIGELREHDYDINRIWDHPRALMARKSIKQRQCPGCWSPCEAYPAIFGQVMRPVQECLGVKFK